MNEEILKKLEARLDRRSFLRGSSIGVAALLGVAATPLSLRDRRARSTTRKDRREEDQGDPTATRSPTRSPPRWKRTEVLRPRRGVEVRECPECGRQHISRAAPTCENSGL
jgi:hypothetical protein